MKKLQLKEMGCKGTGYRNGSDLPNCRLRANFTDVNGLEVCCDFGGWQRRDASKKGCPDALLILDMAKKEKAAGKAALVCEL